MRRVFDVPARLDAFADYFRDMALRNEAPNAEEMGYLVEQMRACAAETRSHELLVQHLIRQAEPPAAALPAPAAEARPRLFGVIEGGRA
jgi:hypothetical protein